LPPEWIFNKKWGACSSLCPVSVSKDPHLHLPHGGRADFRGKGNTVFNLLSARDVTLNVLFEAADFAWATRLVHGTKMAAAYWVLRTESGKTITIEYSVCSEAHAQAIKNSGYKAPASAAKAQTAVAIVREKDRRDVKVREGQPALMIDDLQVAMLSSKTLTVVNRKWRFTASTSPFPFGKLDANKNKVLLDVAIQPLYDADSDVVGPHGIIGQSYDGDSLAVDGRMDEHKAGESTTAAQAEGAIEGSWEDYIVKSPFATDFKYSHFDATAAPHRDVSKLSGSKKPAVATSVAGATDQEERSVVAQ